MGIDNIKMAQTFLEEFDVATVQQPRIVREHYLGMSSIGGCAAELWRQYHSEHVTSNIGPKLQRIFDLGNSIEDLTMETLHHMGGIEIVSTQQEYLDFDNRFRGHSDFVYRMNGRYLVADVKSMNDRNFQRFCQVGTRRFNWKYWCQLQVYAGYEGADTVQLIAYNKNTSEISTAFDDFDPMLFEHIKARADMIINSPVCPPCEKGDGRVKYCSCEEAGNT